MTHLFDAILAADRTAKECLEETWIPPILNPIPEYYDRAYLYELRKKLSKIKNRKEELDLVYDNLKEAMNEFNYHVTKITVGERTILYPLQQEFFEENNPSETKRQILNSLKPVKSLLIEFEEALKECQSYAPLPIINNSIPSPPNINFTTPNVNQIQNNSLVPINPNRHVSSYVRLPQLQLPTFNGSISEWTSFWERFKFTVHDVNPNDLPPVYKLYHLYDCLKGEALDCISGLAMEDASYEIAINLLKEEYGRSDLVIKTLYNKLQILTIPSTCNEDLHKFVDNLEKILLQLENLGQDINSPQTYVTIQKKLPWKILQEILRDEKQIPDWSLAPTRMLRKKLKIISRCNEEGREIFNQNDLERNIFSQNSSNSFQKISYKNNSPVQTPRTTKPIVETPKSSLTFTSQNGNVKTPESNTHYPCVFCSNFSHATTNCQKYGTIEARIDRLKELKRCINCAKVNHYASNCPNNPICNYCKEQHHIWICPKKIPLKNVQTLFINQLTENLNSEQTNSRFTSLIPKKPENNFPSINSEVTNDSEETEKITNTSLNVISPKKPVLLKCIKAIISNPDNPELQKEVLLLFDDGSTNTYISTSLSKSLSLPKLGEDTLNFGVFNEAKSKSIKSITVKFNVQLLNGNNIELIGNTIAFLTQPIPHSLIETCDLTALDNKTLMSCEWGLPEILIGSDFYYNFSIATEKILPSGFALIKSTLGYMLGGQGSIKRNESKLSHMLNVVNLPNDKFIKNFFSLESLGIKEPEIEDKNTLLKFEQSIKLIDGRYSVCLPWKKYPPDLPINYKLSLGRLRSVIKFLKDKPDLLTKYDKIIKEQLDLKIIEEAPAQNPLFPTHYLPHQPVVREDKGKVRIVYDASSHLKNLNSLNDCLDPGPVLLENLAGILLRVRLPCILIACDIEKAFLQVAVRPEDRDATRFLWFREMGNFENPENLVVYRFTRVAFGLTCSPFLLAATIKTHLKDSPSMVAKDVTQNLYVDNILLFSSSNENAIEKCKETKSIFQDIGMNVREFISNKVEVLNTLPEEDKLKGFKHKILGTCWDTESDNFYFSLPPIPNDKIISKRNILSVLSALYDPLGFFSPVLLPGKLFFQTLWDTSLKWDDKLDVKSEKIWLKILESWTFEEVQISRPILSLALKVRNTQIHCFVDASQKAFACCIYLVSNYFNRPSQSKLIFAKIKVKPKKFGEDFSIHRMELLATLIGVRASMFVKTELLKDTISDLSLKNQIILWTDSSTVLHWLQSNTKQSLFIENRLKEIKKTPDLICHYIKTEENPADVASRGCTINELRENKIWWDGPEWLTKIKWPISPLIPSFNSNNDSPKIVIQEVTLNASLNDNYTIDPKRFSSWQKLLGSTAYFLRYLKILALKTRKNLKSVDTMEINYSKTLSLSELKLSQIFLFKESQRLNPPKESEIRDLNLYLDDKNLLRSKGRINKSSIINSAKTPIYSSADSRITQLWIYNLHLSYAHSGTLTTLSQSRFSVWIPKGRRKISQIINKMCFNCRKLKVSAFRIPNFPPLPIERIDPTPPFQNCGVDYFGPINIKTNSGISKIWVALFTCLVVRAIHLEIVHNLSTESFIMALRRFVSRRGFPKTLISDNGTQFVLASKTLNSKFIEEWKDLFSSDELNNYLSKKGIKWTFITEHAPWRGGFYERMIGLVKNNLRRSIGKSLLNFDQLNTLLAEIENVINSRPITFSSDKNENPTPLRPIDFLLINTDSRNFFPFSDNETSDSDYLGKPSTDKNLLNLWKISTKKLDQFWNSWLKDYLLSIRERQKRLNQDINKVPNKGDVVLVYDENLPRSLWKIAIVVGGEPSKDGLIRTATIRLSSGHVTKRALNHLFPLETSGENL